MLLYQYGLAFVIPGKKLHRGFKRKFNPYVHTCVSLKRCFIGISSASLLGQLCGTMFENGFSRARHHGALFLLEHALHAYDHSGNEEQLFNGRKLTFTLFPDAHYHCRQLISKLWWACPLLGGWDGSNHARCTRGRRDDESNSSSGRYSINPLL